MASVLHVSQLPPAHTNLQHFSDMEPSLSLDLSLGGLFSMGLNRAANCDSVQKTSRASESPESSACSVPVESDACPTTRLNLSSPRSLEIDLQLHPKDVTSIEAGSPQLQSKHDPRKKRKNVSDCKVQKRGKLEEPRQTTPLLEYLTPNFEFDGKSLSLSIDQAEMQGRAVSEVHGCKSFAAAAGTPTGTSSEAEFGLETRQLPSFSEVKHKHDQGSLKACRSVVGCGNHGTKNWIKPTVRREFDAAVASPAFKEHARLPCVTPVGKDADCKLMSTERDVVSKSMNRSLASISSGQLTSFAPSESQCLTDAGTSDTSCSRSYSQDTTPGCGSSSRTSSWKMRDNPEGRLSVGEKEECMDGSCNSSSSEIGNEQCDSKSMRMSDRVFSRDFQADQAQSGPTAGRAYPFLVMPLPHSYGAAVPWSLPYPWFVHGLPSITPSYPSAVNVQSKEAIVTPYSGFFNPYQSFPVRSGSNVPTWLPVSAGAVNVPSLPEMLIPGIPSVRLSEKFVASGNEGHQVPEFDQSNETNGNFALDSLPVPMVEEQRKDVAVSTVNTTAHFPVHHPQLDKHSNRNWKEPGSLVGADNCPPLEVKPTMLPETVHVFPGDALKAGSKLSKAICASSRECGTATEISLSGGRQQSLPLEEKKIPRKKKVVRFNCLTLAETRVMSGETESPVIDDRKNALQQCAIPLSSENPHHIEASKGPSGDGIETLQANKPNLNSHVSSTCDSLLADDARHSDNATVNADQERAMRGFTGSSPPLKSALKNKSGPKHSLAGLPRVVTRGPAPKGKTIHGVMYITPEKQVRLICVCHGEHMSPVEFVQHSGSSDLSNPERNIVLESFTQ